MTRILRLSDFADIGAGNSAPQNANFFKNGTLPFVRTSDVGAIHIGSIETSRDLLTPEGAKGLRLQPSGTILFPKSGASTFLNHRVLLDRNAYVSSHLATIKANNELALDRYLFYFLQTIDARDLCQDQAYPSLNRDQIAGIEVPIPDLETQYRVVESLESAFAEIDQLEKNLKSSDEKSKQLLNSVLNAVLINTPNKVDSKSLEGESLRLGNACTFEYGKPLDQQFRKSEGEFKAYGANGPISSSTKYLVEGPCIIVGRKGSAGEITYVMESVWPLDVTYYVKHDKSKSDLRYLFYLLKSLDLKQFVRGVKPGLNRNDAYNLLITLPSLARQREIALMLDAVNKEVETLGNLIAIKRDFAVMLRQSLLSSAFSFDNEMISI